MHLIDKGADIVLASLGSEAGIIGAGVLAMSGDETK